MDKVRCLLFNFLFYGIWTPIACIGLLPTLFVSQSTVLAGARLYQRGTQLLEKYVLGLDYVIRGAEHRPKAGQGTYLVAAKHQSAYETTKLYLLFDNPAVILKKELLSLPLFGRFLKALDVIAIDRGNRAEAQKSLLDGGRKIKAQGRPIVIFPQGTRVSPDDTAAKKPYKGGIGKLYSELDVPVYPVALNTGVYWPRNSFWKRPGQIVIEFLPPILPGLAPEEMMREMEARIEAASNALTMEGRLALTAR